MGDIQDATYGCELVQEAALLLRMPQVTSATGQTLVQRVYREGSSLLKLPVINVSLAALYLASKLEETPRKLTDFLNVFHHIQKKRSGRGGALLEPSSDEYWEWKSILISTERALLVEMGFRDVYVEHPHKYLLGFLKTLGAQTNQRFVQRAWNIMNDSLKTSACIKFKPEVVAVASIAMAARYEDVPLPETSVCCWYSLFDATQQELDEFALMVAGLYSRTSSTFSQVPKSTITPPQGDNAKNLDEFKEEESKSNISGSSENSQKEICTPSLYKKDEKITPIEIEGNNRDVKREERENRKSSERVQKERDTSRDRKQNERGRRDIRHKRDRDRGGRKDRDESRDIDKRKDERRYRDQRKDRDGGESWKREDSNYRIEPRHHSEKRHRSRDTHGRRSKRR